MFGIGSTELLVILVVALIVLGPKSLAGVSRSLGKAVGEFRKVSTDFQRTLNMESAREEAREARKKKAQEAAGAQNVAVEHNAAGSEEQSPRSNGETASEADTIAGIPPDSPVAKALAKAKMEAASKGAAVNQPEYGNSPQENRDLSHHA